MSDGELLHSIGRRLQIQRLDKNLSQEELAKAAGLGRTTVAKLEAGHAVNLLSFLQVLRALGVLDEFERFLPDPRPSPLQLAKLQGKKRCRASRKRHETAPGEGFEW